MQWPVEGGSVGRVSIDRAEFLRLLGSAVAGVYLGGCTRGAPNEPVPLYAGRHRSGVWGLTARGAASEGALVAGPDGVMGLVERVDAGACALRYPNGYVGIRREGGATW